MKFKMFAATIALLLLVPFSINAQDYEDENFTSKLSFQGRVGLVSTGGEPFRNGATFSLGSNVRITGPIFLSMFVGTGYFKADGELRPISDDFADFWRVFEEQNEVLVYDEINYRLNFGGAGIALKRRFGRFEPFFHAGFGIYQTKFVATFHYVDKAVPEEFWEDFSQFVSIQDSKMLLGYNYGGGLNYYINQIIGFGGDVTFHGLNTDAIEDQISYTFGLSVQIP